MEQKIKISLMAIIAIAGISTGVFAFESSENTEVSKNTVITGSVHDYSIEELSQGATYAISGKVKQIESTIVIRDDRQYVFSDVTINVKDDLFGNYNEKEITVRIQGGQVDDISTVSHVDASFEKNERVLVFVAGIEPNSIWGDNYYVAGMFTGKFNLDENGDAKKSFDNTKYVEKDLKDKIQKHRSDKIK